MQSRHVELHGSSITFHFRGKSGKEHEVLVHDRRVARIVGRCNDLPGEELFQYVDEAGNRRSIEASDVNEFLKTVSGAEFSAKDFRTWAGTVLAARELKARATFDSNAAAKRHLVEAIRTVSSRLGNTPSVCRRCYVHPHVLDAYLTGRLVDLLREGAGRVAKSAAHLSPEETAVLGLLLHHSEAGSDVARAA
jgi:DNA topoisomerase-1